MIASKQKHYLQKYSVMFYVHWNPFL